MIYSLTWLPAVLRMAGLKVATVDGWESRGVGEMGDVEGVICHHTGGPRGGNMPSVRTLVEGRNDLSGPLAQIGLGRDGTCYVLSAGRCNHAGTGVWQGIREGNTRFIGIEAENTGGFDDTSWPAVQMDAYRRAVAALLQRLNRPASFCAGHKEYALPAGRKPDPDFDMDAFRAEVTGILSGAIPQPPLIPASEPTGALRATVRRGDHGPLVVTLQQHLDLGADGYFGALTEAAVRTFQRQRQLVPDGIVGPKTWAALDAS
jgi:N-acetyl-anhydromuramyl-L-alanine amidase AmpD